MAQLKDGTRVYGTFTANTEVVIGTLNVSTTLAASYNTANAAFDKANSANLLSYNTGIGANTWANTVGSSANSYAGRMANSANAYAASLTPNLAPAFAVANAAFNTANSAYAAANNVAPQIAPAFNTANAAYNYANNLSTLEASSYNTANAAYDTANAAWAAANSGSSTASVYTLFTNSSISQFPTVVGVTDFGSVGDNINITDAFGVLLDTKYDCMEPSRGMLYMDSGSI